MIGDERIHRAFYGIMVTPRYIKMLNHYGSGINAYTQAHPEYSVICKNQKELHKKFRQLAEENRMDQFWCKADSNNKILIAGCPDGNEEDLLGPFDIFEIASFEASMAQSRALNQERQY